MLSDDDRLAARTQMNMPDVGGTKLQYLVLIADFSVTRPAADFEYATRTLAPDHTPEETACALSSWNSSAKQSMKKSRRARYSTASPTFR